MLRGAAEEFEQRVFLSTLNDIGNFCEAYGIEEPRSKSRASEIPRVFKFLVTMDVADVERMLDDRMFSGVSCGAYCQGDQPSALTSTGRVTVRVGPVVSITPGHLTVAEDAGTATLTVSLDQPAESALSVSWHTQDERAVAPNDYTAREDSLTFAAGEERKTISVSIVDDAVREDPDPVYDVHETFFVILDSGQGYTRGDEFNALVEIVDNDGDAPPDVIPPQLTQVTPNGNTLVLTYDETLDDESIPAPSDYVVWADGNQVDVSGVSVSGATVTLTLATAVEAGQTAMVGYTPGTNPIQDAAGNDAAPLTANPVTDTPDPPPPPPPPDPDPEPEPDPDPEPEPDPDPDPDPDPEPEPLEVDIVGVPDVAVAGASYELTVQSDEESLVYAWRVANGGSIEPDDEKMVIWTAPATAGTAWIHVDVTHEDGATGGQSAYVRVEVPDQASLTLSAAPAPAEGGDPVTVTATLDTPAPATGLTVMLTTDGTATLDTDYTLSSTTITLAAGETAGTATITVTDDAEDRRRRDHRPCRRKHDPGADRRAPHSHHRGQRRDAGAGAAADRGGRPRPAAAGRGQPRAARARPGGMPVTAGDGATDGSARAGENDTAVTGTLTIAAGGREGTGHVPPHPGPALRVPLLRLASAAPARAPFDVGRGIQRVPLIANQLLPSGWGSDCAGAAGERVGRDPRA